LNAEDLYGKYASALLFDPETLAFTAASDMNAERFKLPNAVAALGSGKILVGGYGVHSEIYDPESQAFH
jgi:hypothetical protein